MTDRRPLRITADQVTDLRKALGETQLEFSWRFSRSRYAVIRWERDGVKFSYQSIRYRAWRRACNEVNEVRTI